MNINGLSGQVLRMPKPTRNARKVLLVYGLGSSLERVRPLADNLHKQAAVVVPDLPGFGGMDSFSKIGLKPSLDSYIDYLATIIKFHFPRQRFVLAGLDYGFAMVNGLLVKYPEIAKQVDFVVSLAGVNDWRELQLPPGKVRIRRLVSTVLARQLPAGVAQSALHVFRPTLHDATPDLRTYLQARYNLLHLTKAQSKSPLTVYYFPGSDCMAVDQTKTLTNLKLLYKKVKTVSEAELICSKSEVQMRLLGRPKKLAWLKP